MFADFNAKDPKSVFKFVLGLVAASLLATLIGALVGR